MDKKQPNETSNEDLTIVQGNDFLEMIQRVNFINESNKNDYAKLFKSNDPNAIAIMKNYYQTRNMIMMKNSLIKKLL